MERNLNDNLVDNSDVMEPSFSVSDVETEKALLSLCLRSKEALNTVIGKSVIAEDFSDNRNVLIYQAIRELFLASKNIDRYTVFEQLESMGKIASAGGSEYVFNVANTVAVLSNLDSYVSIVREKSSHRKFLNVIDDINKKAHKAGNSVEDLVTIAVNELSDLRETNEGGDFDSLGVILKNNINTIVDIAKGKEDNSYKTHFRMLDAMTGGFRPGTLNILAARPGMGKTAFVINIATNIASCDNKPVCIFSLEMSKSEIGNRILASRTDYSAKQLQRGKIKMEETKNLANAYKQLSHLPIYISDRSNVDPVSMLSKCKELKSKGMLGLIIVDYLQLMSMPDMGKNSSRQNEIAAISRSLKILAKDLEVPVIALSQLSRGSEQREDHTPMLSDLRDSGAIEQDADSVLFINRSAYYKKGEAAPEIQDAEIIVAKNRHGETGPVYLKWWGAKTLFFEPDRKSDPKDPATNGMQSSSESSFSRTQTSGAAASDYNFEETSAPAPVPEDIPFEADQAGDPEPPPENQDNSAFFAESNDDFPADFM